MRNTNRIQNREKWQEIVRAFEESGLRVSEFCRERGLSESSLRGWRVKLSGQNTAAESEGFRELKAQSSDGSGYRITLQSGRSLSVSDSFREPQLRKLIEILESC